MMSFSHALEEYLTLRRNLGFELKTVEGFLVRFVAYLEEQGATHITTELALRWAMQPSNVQPPQRARRLGIARQFAEYLYGIDPLTEIPPKGLLPFPYRRKSPHIYNHEEIESLLDEARELASASGLRAQTYSVLFGLLAVTGMRVSESITLDNGDVDLEAGVLRIRRTKFGKTRLIPVHASTAHALAEYASFRNRIHPHPATDAFFLSETGERLKDGTTRWNFAMCSRRTGLRQPAAGYKHGHGPRLHDLRHSFAVQTILTWYRQGLNVERHLPKLSTYLGHTAARNTYWYLTAIPELMHLALARLDLDEGRSRP